MEICALCNCGVSDEKKNRYLLSESQHKQLLSQLLGRKSNNGNYLCRCCDAKLKQFTNASIQVFGLKTFYDTRYLEEKEKICGHCGLDLSTKNQRKRRHLLKSEHMEMLQSVYAEKGSELNMEGKKYLCRRCIDKVSQCARKKRSLQQLVHSTGIVHSLQDGGAGLSMRLSLSNGATGQDISTPSNLVTKIYSEAQKDKPINDIILCDMEMVGTTESQQQAPQQQHLLQPEQPHQQQQENASSSSNAFSCPSKQNFIKDKPSPQVEEKKKIAAMDLLNFLCIALHFLMAFTNELQEFSKYLNQNCHGKTFMHLDTTFNDDFDTTRSKLNTMQIKLKEKEYNTVWEVLDEMKKLIDDMYKPKPKLVDKFIYKLLDDYEEEIDTFMKNLGYCCGQMHTYDPQTLCCDGKNCTIRRNASYYGYDNNRYVYCTKCFDKVKEETIPVGDSTSIKKSFFEKKKNAIIEEPMVKCVYCERKMHQKCVLHVDRSKDFKCMNCLKDRGIAMENAFSAKNVPENKLSKHLEDWVKKNFDKSEQKKIGEVIIRVMYAEDMILKTWSLINDIFPDFPREFSYRMKFILAFQNIDEEDVCIFGMYVQEYGSNNDYPNNRCVYIAYLDSVKLFQPKELRTKFYQWILLGYLDFCRIRGFQSPYIWSCPPQKGDDYIFNCHPKDQLVQTQKRLNEWYDTVLKEGKELGVVIDFKIINIKEISSVTDLPYFKGNFWPNEIEDTVKKLSEKGKSPNSVDRAIINALAKKQIYCIQINLNTASPLPNTKDPDNPIPCDLMKDREVFLEMCKRSHWKFLSMREDKFSTKAMLHWWHTSVPNYTCNNCNVTTEMTRHHCKTCDIGTDSLAAMHRQNHSPARIAPPARISNTGVLGQVLPLHAMNSHPIITADQNASRGDAATTASMNTQPVGGSMVQNEPWSGHRIGTNPSTARIAPLAGKINAGVLVQVLPATNPCTAIIAPPAGKPNTGGPQRLKHLKQLRISTNPYNIPSRQN